MASPRVAKAYIQDHNEFTHGMWAARFANAPLFVRILACFPPSMTSFFPAKAMGGYAFVTVLSYTGGGENPRNAAAKEAHWMLMIVVDEARPSLEYFIHQARKVQENNRIVPFTDPYDALSFLKENPADIAVLAMEMMGMSGLEMAIRTKDLCPNIKIIFTAGISASTQGPFVVCQHGYLSVPVDPEELEREIAYVLSHTQELPKTYLRTFGSFALIHDGVPVTFSREASEEMLAYLVYMRGQWVDNDRLAALLAQQGDTPRIAMDRVRNAAQDLLRDIKMHGLSDLVKRRRDTYCIDLTVIPCDMELLLQGNVEMINTYEGAFMPQYTWAHIPLSVT